ncbi:MAG: hypothetical protein A2X77_05535 [Gammaproteobacteria bacterium GWE2_42_36]|nr:MAG: hypothetical protein A2X77_05535 [Gammaproteobacteria bacterium GWE2_42_36]HCU05682.1 hypothetical protein [Coxiellaceae bacterium]
MPNEQSTENLTTPMAATTTQPTEKFSVTITPIAAAQLYQYLKTENKLSAKLRVFAEMSGCCGMQFGFSLEDMAHPQDEIIEVPIEAEKATVTVLVDSFSQQYLRGATIDFSTTTNSFMIRNPNTESGGGGCASCGEGCGGCGGAQR